MEKSNLKGTLPDRFRCHPSIILEQLGAVFILIVLSVLSNLQDIVKDVQEGNLSLDEEGFGALLIFGVIVFILAMVIGFCARRWSKTYISIVDNTIVYEINTLNKKKNTIGIKNISNVNIEQNILEMILGTCKVKLDTNSLSTADSTDLKIVLKKDKAQLFRRRVMELMGEADASDSTQNEVDIFEEKNYDIISNSMEVFKHGLYSIRVFTVLIALGSVMGTYMLVKETIGKGSQAGDVLSILSTIVVIGFIFFSSLYSIAKGFFQYYGFQAKRVEDKIYLKFGLFKKVNYAIPVNKINAVCLRQTLIARICKKYTVELINVGMGDEKQEESSFLLLYDSLEQIREYLKLLLPEFELEEGVKCEKQPLSAFWVRLLGSAWYLILWVGVILFFAEFAKSFLIPVCVYGGALLVIWWLIIGLSMWNDGITLGNHYMKTAYGRFGTTYKWIAYDKIQYIQLNQNMIAKKLGIAKGNVYVLASMANRVHNLPYFSQDKSEQLKNKILER